MILLTCLHKDVCTILLTCLHKDGECDSHATEAEVGNTGTKKVEG